jgi:hypothetical protein
MSKYSIEDLKTFQALDLIAGSNGTIKMHPGTYTGPFKAICFSEASTITSIADGAGGDKDTYYTETTYTSAAGDILVAHNMRDGGRFTSAVLAAGSAIIIL